MNAKPSELPRGLGELPEYITIEELAPLLTRHSVATVYGWRYFGTAPRATKVGRRVLFQRDDVARWLEDRVDSADNVA